MDLDQVDSPPLSAKAFASWVLEEFNNPMAPLGTVELLLSPESEVALSEKMSKTVRPATMTEIREAFDRWYNRCDTDPQNIALFYFCGHGVSHKHTILLPQDYGARNNAPFDNAFDLHGSWEGMGRCKAELQCAFIDACRQSAWSLQKYSEEPARPLIDPIKGTKSNRDAPRYMATGPADSAYGKTGEVTDFTKALLHCLKRGALKQRGEWLITTFRLGEALSLAMQEKMNPDRPQLSSMEDQIVMGRTIHRMSQPPEIPVSLGCAPEEATRYAHLALASPDEPTKLHYQREIPAAGPWQLVAQAGHYTALANFPNKQYQTGKCPVWVDPPGPTVETVPVLI